MRPGVADQSNVQKSKAFAALFLIEMWERFGYYGMGALMVLFMTTQRDFSDKRAVLIWGAFVAMIYAMPTIGGYIGDKYLGARRTMTFGAIVLMGGYLLLAIPSKETFFISMGVIAIGNGLFKVNPNNLLSRLYEDDTAKLDSAFTAYYMSINIGSMISIFITPIVAHFYSWHLAFGISALGLALGLINYAFMRKHLQPYGSAPDFEKLNYKRLFNVIAGTCVMAYLLSLIIQHQIIAESIMTMFGLVALGVFAFLMFKFPEERNHLAACLVLITVVIVFFVYYQQMTTSLTLFAKQNVAHQLLGVHILPAQFQDMNPIWIVILSPLVAWFYNRMGNRKGDFNIATKYAFGLFLSSAAFFVFAVSGLTAVNGTVSAWWMVAGYGLQSFAELIISGLGLAMIARLVPKRLRGFMMGAYFLGTAVAQYIGGAIAGIASVPEGVTDPVKSLPLYTELFMKLGIAALIAAVILSCLVPWLKRLIDEAPAEPA
ncbi:peptide MFS transporter [Salinisphaera orenii]|uniref:peptide MFS transporter n=1 Tax=Salinisphaera orenii TaxID=856731 RepID=UPI000DBE847B